MLNLMHLFNAQVVAVIVMLFSYVTTAWKIPYQVRNDPFLFFIEKMLFVQARLGIR